MRGNSERVMRQRARSIVALPTLVRRLLPPVRRIIGDLSYLERVLLGLNIVRLDGVSD